MPCESLDSMWMIPRSCRTPSAAIVAGRTRAWAAVRSPWMRPGSSTWTAATIAACSAAVSTPNGTVGVVEEVRIRSRPARRSRSGAWPPPAPSMWKAWTERPANAASVPSTESTSLRPSVWIASWTSWRSQTSSAVRIWAGPAPTSSWIFSAAPPARRPSSTRSAREEEPRTKSAALIGVSSSAAQVVARPDSGLVPRFQTGP